ncbi:Protein smg [mine drainage metagenome]|uniref:Protein smg n=1 Tax=mine drainage metagenome TaxID=410659 RepID=T1BIH2_9ZZZZ
MHDRILDVLAFLYETHFAELDGEIEENLDPSCIVTGLKAAGFSEQVAQDAIQWLGDLDEMAPDAFFEPGEPHNGLCPVPQRIYTLEEMACVNISCRGLLHLLEETGVINPLQREIVIERACALGFTPVDAHDLKWVILFVLRGRYGSSIACSMAEDILFRDPSVLLH